MTVALTGALRPVLINVLGPGILDSVFGYIIQGVPLAILTFAFGFIYFFLPNTKVSFRPALFGGFIAAIGYYLMQAGYVYFQVSMTRYNAIYGSFAALPLFLIWLQASWLIVLFGAQMAFANENRENFLYEPDSRGASEKTKQQFAISIVGKVIERFQNGERSLSLNEVTKSYKASSQFIRGLLEELTDAGILSAICPDEESDEMPRYQPARPIDQLGKDQIIELMISRGNKSLLDLNPDLTR
jgi:membrane protein